MEQHDYMEQEILTGYDTIETPEFDIEGRVLNRIDQPIRKKPRWRAVSVAVCALLLVAVGAGVWMFSGTFTGYTDVGGDGGAATQVVGSAVDQGIEIEVVSAELYGEELVGLIRLRDLEGERITEEAAMAITIADIDGKIGPTSTRTYAYDEETASLTMTFHSTTTSLDVNQPLSLSTDMIYASFTDMVGLDMEVDLAALEEMDTQVIPYNRMEPSEIVDDGADGAKGLGIGELDIPIGENGQWWISNMGLVDGEFHILIANHINAAPPLGDTLIYPYLLDSGGERVVVKTVFDYTDDALAVPDPEPGELLALPEYDMDTIRYSEYILAPVDVSASYSLIVDYTQVDLISGEWEIPLAVEPNTDELVVASDLQFETVRLDAITVTPYAVTLSGEGYLSGDDFSPDITLILEDGREIELPYAGPYVYQGDGSTEEESVQVIMGSEDDFRYTVQLVSYEDIDPLQQELSGPLDLDSVAVIRIDTDENTSFEYYIK